MEHSIKISGETVYHPLHEQLYPIWDALVTAHEFFGATEEVVQMKESYIQMRLQTESGMLWEDRPRDWEEDYELAKRMEESA